VRADAIGAVLGVVQREVCNAQKGNVPVTVVLAVFAVVAGSVPSAAAADLSGAAWVLSGPMTTKGKIGRYVERETATVGSHLEFGDGTCALDTGRDVLLPCTWSSPDRRKLVLGVNAEPLRAALEEGLEDEFGPGLAVSLSVTAVKGRRGRDLSSLTLKLRFTGTVTGAMLPKTMKLWIKATQSGGQVTMAPPESAERAGLASRLAAALERALNKPEP
jgi:hypothetical protein